MLVLAYFDWYGTAEELKEQDKAIKDYASKHEGLEYMGRYGPHNKKYHWVRIFKTDKYPLPQAPTPRDYKKMTHWVSELLSGPVE